jgi:hypothetical protein
MLEGLTKYWGFYIVAAPDSNDVGVADLDYALNQVEMYNNWLSDIRSLPPREQVRQTQSNRRIAR